MDVAYLLPTGGLMAQADCLVQRSTATWRCCYIHRVNRSRPCNRFPMLRRVRNCPSYYYYYYYSLHLSTEGWLG